MLRHCKLVMTEGQQAAVFATMLWERMDDLQRGAILWDAPANARQYLFEDTVARASLVAVGIGTGGPELLTWLNGTAPGSQTACIHLASANASLPILTDYGREFLARISGEYRCLFSLVPGHWLGTRRLAAALGFCQIGAFPKACRIASHNRCVDGVMLQWTAPPACAQPRHSGRAT